MRGILCEDIGKPGGACTVVYDVSDCPNRANHTPMPGGYGSWHDRATELARTHVQRRCAGCGLWAIWEPKAPPTTRPHSCPSCRCEPEETP